MLWTLVFFAKSSITLGIIGTRSLAEEESRTCDYSPDLSHKRTHFSCNLSISITLNGECISVMQAYRQQLLRKKLSSGITSLSLSYEYNHSSYSFL